MRNAKSKGKKDKRTVVNWRKYCYSKEFEKIYAYDNSNPALTYEMAKHGFMQLTLCKFATDAYGNDVTKKLQFKVFEAPPEIPVRYFDNWDEVRMFLDMSGLAMAMEGAVKSVQNTKNKHKLHDAKSN